MKDYFVIGLMSGTSLDGLDIAYCKFTFDLHWSYNIIAFETIHYSTSFKDKLRKAPSLNTIDIGQLSNEFGLYMAQNILMFVEENSISTIDLVASHGHTVFHEPNKGVTLQIGDPQPIYEAVKVPVAYDFRTQDVALGGQGAPLVPFVDSILFNQCDACLNLGGFSNISFSSKNKRLAFDICPVNIVLNLWATKLGFDYDDKGSLASSGKLNLQLLDELNKLEYYSKSLPKSLGWEWVENTVIPILEKYNLAEVDIMRTFSEHVAIQMVSAFDAYSLRSVLISGGGVYNKFIIQRMKQLSSNTLFKIEPKLIETKEAMAFAFLGLMRLKKQNNIESSVTGAVKDHCSGKIYPEEL